MESWLDETLSPEVRDLLGGALACQNQALGQLEEWRWAWWRYERWRARRGALEGYAMDGMVTQTPLGNTVYCLPYPHSSPAPS